MANYNHNISAILYNDESTIPDISDSSDSPSLPSLSLNCQMNRNVPQISPTNFNMTNNSNNDSLVPLETNCWQKSMTMREYDTKLNELKTENFNLKLRIYILEKEKTGVSQPEYESTIAKELLKREKTIRAYQKIVEQKDEMFKENKLKYESKLNEKDLVIDSMVNEKETLTNELTETSSVCRLLMAHLSEFVDFWKRYLPMDSNDPNDMMASLLNSSEDLLNSASVLITNDGNESLRNKSCFGYDMRNTTQMSGNNSSQNGVSLRGVGFPNFLEHHFRQPIVSQLELTQTIVDQFCGLSSESDDIWSEPDRDVSRARIALDNSVTNFVPNSPNNSKPKHKPKRRTSVATGMSSLGLLSDMSGLIIKSNARTSIDDKVLPTVSFVGKSTQTELTNVTLNNILSSYYEFVNKRVVHKETQSELSFISYKSSETQTDAKQMNNSSIQTDIILTHDKSIATKSFTLCDSSSQCNGFSVQNKEIQYELIDTKVNDFQTDRTEVYSMGDNNIFSTDEEREKFIPVRTKPKSLSPNSKRCQNSHDRLSTNTLYTYKASLSPLKNTLRSKTKESHPTDHNYSRVETNGETENLLINHKSVTKDDYLFKVPNDDLINNKTKKQTFINKSNDNNKQTNISNKAIISSRLSSSSSSLEGVNRVSENGSLLQLNVNCFNKNNNSNGDHLSSPDLGIGDSDFDLVNIGQNGIGLRVYASVGHFKLLKEQINQAICSVNAIDRLNDDFRSNIIDYHEFVSNFKPKISNINQLMSCSRNICRKFVIEDNEALLKRLEKMKISKEKMEKAITKQLHKTDILLKKARINLKDN